jgi:hypothetical protein
MASGQTPPSPPSLRVIGPGVAGLFSLLVFASLPLLPILGVFLALLAPLPLVHVVAHGRTSFLAWGWVAIGLVAAVFLFPEPWLVGVLPGDGLVRLFTRMLTGASELVKAFAAGGGGEELLARATRTVGYLVPSLVALYVLTGALWLRPRLPLLGLSRGAEPFPLYTSEEWLPVGFALGGLGWVFAPEPYKWLAANLLVTVLGLYFVHGLAIILFYLGRRFGSNRWVRLGVMVFALQVPVALVFSALGLADTFFRLRHGGANDGGPAA